MTDSDNPGASPESDKKSGGVARRGIITLVGAVVGGGTVLINEVLVARFMGAEVYGYYALAFVFARISEIASSFGLRIGVLHFLPVYIDEKRNDRVFGVIAEAILLPAVVSSLLVPTIWLLAPWLASDVLNEPAATRFVRLFAVAIPFMCLSELLGGITRGFGHAALYVAIRNIIPPITFLLGMLGLSYFEADPTFVVGAFGLGHVLAVAVGAVAVAKLMGADVLRTQPTFAYRELYLYSFPILVNTLLYMVIGFSDILMLGASQGAQQAGIYRACNQVVPAFETIVLAFNAAAIHLYPVLINNKKRDELDSTFATVNRWTASLCMLLFLLVALNRDGLLAILGPDFSAGSSAILILLVGMLLHSGMGSAGILLVVSGHQKYETTNATTGAVTNIALNILLIPRYGLTGAAAATAISLAIMNVLRVVEVRRLLRLSTPRLALLRLVGVGIGVGAIVLTLGQFFRLENQLLEMTVRMSFTAVIFVYLLWQFAVTGDEKKQMREFLQKRRYAQSAERDDSESKSR